MRPAGKRILICVVIAAVCTCAATPLATAATRQAKVLSTDNLRKDLANPFPVKFHDRVVTHPGWRLSRRLQLFDSGGVYYTQDGLPVNVYLSDSYTPNPSVNQSVATFLGTLLHGSELANLNVYVRTPAEVTAMCGDGALACYIPSEGNMIISGEDVPGEPPVEEIATHEYGHRIAAYRNNAPFDSNSFGPKYWATDMNVCALTRRGVLFPGAEELPQYMLNPGEGWGRPIGAGTRSTPGGPQSPSLSIRTSPPTPPPWTTSRLMSFIRGRETPLVG